MHVGELLNLLDELGIANNTIVLYSTDNGPITILGPMPGPHPSALKRTPTGRERTGYPRL
jgi:arylsulfatase A-like enzyme